MSKSGTDINLDGGHKATTGRHTPTYLLFAGMDHPPRGGLHDLVGTFASEQEARKAFGAIRSQPPSPTTWAQLAVVDGGEALKPVCWFGIGAAPDGSPIKVPELVGTLPDTHAGWRPRVSKRTAFALTAMVAVATSMVGFLVDGSGSRPPVHQEPAVVVTLPHTAPSTSVQPSSGTPAMQFEGGASADG